MNSNYQEWHILNPSISSLELSWVIFHLKPSLRIVAIMVLINDPSSSFILPMKKFLVSLFISVQFFFPWVVGCQLIIWDVFHKTISSLFFSFSVFQQLRSSICCKRALSRSCFPLFIPFHSYFCSGGIVMLLSSTHLVLSGSCSFHAYPLTGVCARCSSSFILSSLSSLLTGVFSTLFIFVFFFLSICSTSEGSLVSLIGHRSNLVLPLLSSLPFSLRCHSRSRDEIPS